MILEKSRTVQNINAQKIRLSGESLRVLPIHGGRYAPGVDGINTDTVVTDHDVAEDNAPDLGYRHFPSLNLIELFLFQRGEEALHPGVVIAAARSAHALDGTVPGEGVELVVPVAMEDHAAGELGLTGGFERPDA